MYIRNILFINMYIVACLSCNAVEVFIQNQSQSLAAYVTYRRNHQKTSILLSPQATKSLGPYQEVANISYTMRRIIGYGSLQEWNVSAESLAQCGENKQPMIIMREPQAGWFSVGEHPYRVDCIQKSPQISGKAYKEPTKQQEREMEQDWIQGARAEQIARQIVRSFPTSAQSRLGIKLKDAILHENTNNVLVQEIARLPDYASAILPERTETCVQAIP